MTNISFKKEFLKFLGLFLILYFIVFVVLNLTGWLIRPKPLENSQVVTKVSQREDTFSKKEEKEPKCLFSEKPNSIFIPKIGIEAPLVFPAELEQKDYKKALDQGVVHYPTSSLPGEKGEIILLGHSAPPGWPKIRYDWVFSDLNKLNEGDVIYIVYERCQYKFVVSEKVFLEKGEELPPPSKQSKTLLTLISCWPPGKNIKRIAVRALEE